MIQVTPQMRVVVAVEPADFRRGDRQAGPIVQRGPQARPVQRVGVRVPQPAGDGHQGAGVRRPGVLALSQTPFERPIPLVARPRQRSLLDTGGAPGAGTLFGGEPTGGANGAGVAAGRSGGLSEAMPPCLGPRDRA